MGAIARLARLVLERRSERVLHERGADMPLHWPSEVCGASTTWRSSFLRPHHVQLMSLVPPSPRHQTTVLKHFARFTSLFSSLPSAQTPRQAPVRLCLERGMVHGCPSRLPTAPSRKGCGNWVLLCQALVPPLRSAQGPGSGPCTAPGASARGRGRFPDQNACIGGWGAGPGSEDGLAARTRA